MLTSFLAEESFTLGLILACLILSAFFSSVETAITSLGTIKVKHILDQKGKKAAALILWLKHPGRVITTILLFNNVVNILASSVTTKLTYKYFESGAVGIATGITTFWVLVFGEIIPKSFAKSHAESLAIFSMRFISFFYFISYPLVRGLSSLAEFVIRLISKGSKTAPLITEEEIEFIVSEGEKAGVIQDLKKDIIEGAFDFDETKVREIMTPRTNLTAFFVDTPLDEIVEETIKTGHSRIPVYRDNIDHIVGVVLAKDLLKYTSDGSAVGQNVVAKDLMRDAHFAPESKSIMEVFKDLKRTKSHMAIIIDEYGGTAGIVTMEDILEEIVGEIQDEYDAEEAQILKIEENVYEVAGSMNIDEFFEHFKVDEKTLKESQKGEDVDTLAGWVTQLIGEMPKPGQIVDVGPLNLEVLEVSQRRIDIVKVIERVEAKNTEEERAAEDGREQKQEA
ncbi:MAG: HlyC/CorC family transporter [Oligoflexales bacterium]|nr:HlyC/CorC family transporter [Oligoflexales bacterium]